MNPNATWCPWDANDEIAALIKTLHETGQRLEVLTSGEIDTVADRTGRMFLLRRAQEQLRVNEAVKQAAILDALPAQIALLDIQGRITSVNDAWLRLAGKDTIQGAGFEIGQSCLPTSGSSPGSGSTDTRRIAAGIQSVLDGGAMTYSVEYPCHSPTEQRWFLMIVSSLAADHPNGAVVMRMDVTGRRRLETAVTEAASREQQRFALDLHDVLGQDLVGLSLLAGATAKQSRAGATVDPTDLDQIASIAAKACMDARTMAHGLAPIGMASGSLETALRRLAAATGELHGVAVSFITHDHVANGIAAHKAEHVYRIAQEAVWNTIKHARCRQTIISLSVRNAWVCLTIRDDGRAVAPNTGTPGIGVELMHYRADLIGGHLSIDVQRNGGTRVRCMCPAK